MSACYPTSRFTSHTSGARGWPSTSLGRELCILTCGPRHILQVIDNPSKYGYLCKLINYLDCCLSDLDIVLNCSLSRGPISSIGRHQQRPNQGCSSGPHRGLCRVRRVAAVPCFPRACEVYLPRVGTRVQIEIFEDCPVFIGDAREIQSMPKEPGRSLHFPGR
jgi:hypothetical protein